MYAPTSGEGYINGSSIQTDMSTARESLGLCPQHNMLISDLTVREHFVFFGMVRALDNYPGNRQTYLWIIILVKRSFESQCRRTSG
jgi:ABC-type multidrug transport system ATPase subunit